MAFASHLGESLLNPAGAWLKTFLRAFAVDRGQQGQGCSLRSGPFLTLVVLIALVLLTFPGASAFGEPPTEGAEGLEARLYRTAAERREVGLGRQITPWLRFSGLLELAGRTETLQLAGANGDERDSIGAAALQFGLIATPQESFRGELVAEYDTETRALFTEEAILSFVAGPWELEAGVYYLPFGEYISHFATGPLLEFGETRAPAATLTYGLGDHLDLLASLYRGSSRRPTTDRRPLSWVLAMETSPTDSLSFGLSLQSNLADSEDHLLADTNNTYMRRVPGLSGYMVWTTPEVEITLEGLGATREFAELDEDRDQPRAWNLELVHFTRRDLEWALRFEGSRELEDKPEIQLGVAMTWRPYGRASLTLEFLTGRFEGGLATNDRDEPHEYVHSIGAQFSFAF